MMLMNFLLAVAHSQEALKEWVDHLATVKLGLTAHTAARAYYMAQTVIESLHKKNRSIADKYISAACLVVSASEQKRIINHLELSVGPFIALLRFLALVADITSLLVASLLERHGTARQQVTTIHDVLQKRAQGRI
jgi:hypothetical protein